MGLILTNAAMTCKRKLKAFMNNERGETNIVAIILIVLVVIALVALFKDQMITVIKNLFSKITGNEKVDGLSS